MSQEESHFFSFPQVHLNQPAHSFKVPAAPIPVQQVPNIPKNDDKFPKATSQSEPSLVVLVLETGTTPGEANASITLTSVASTDIDPKGLPPVISTGATTLMDTSPEADFVPKRATMGYFGHDNIVLNGPVTFNINFGGANMTFSSPINIFSSKNDCSVNTSSSTGTYAVMSSGKHSALAPSSIN
jgi:hypothetical protein